MDNKTRAMLVDEMVKTRGWEIVLEWLATETSKAASKLEAADPADTVAVCKLQERIRSYRYLLRTIENITNEV